MNDHRLVADDQGRRIKTRKDRINGQTYYCQLIDILIFNGHTYCLLMDLQLIPDITDPPVMEIHL